MEAGGRATQGAVAERVRERGVMRDSFALAPNSSPFPHPSLLKGEGVQMIARAL